MHQREIPVRPKLNRTGCPKPLKRCSNEIAKTELLHEHLPFFAVLEMMGNQFQNGPELGREDFQKRQSGWVTVPKVRVEHERERMQIRCHRHPPAPGYIKLPVMLADRANEIGELSWVCSPDFDEIAVEIHARYFK